ncbi:MAG: ABC transporter ATP-binding protein [Rhodanobacter sp.]|nr:MAG: ABC transporter ATP-binding protein [Rhodanobacter sp.]TAM04523.1 MAG: ABC transporter ATP-binding protein [Rhodanobacter sp.]TAM40912.1 MAG: ABC transporter ATP-binding protein [Rhodanobacter sp.]TAN25688.1 MAG: ABC transporter ATP-binding protein [Rhodanobacter sp.]
MTTDASSPTLRVDRLGVQLGGQVILHDVSFVVDVHTTMAVIGASGCGKTTLLRAIAGLLTPAHGEVKLGARRVDLLAPNRRGIVYLNQEPLLFPHLDLFENIAFGLRLRRLPERQVRERVAEMLVQLELDGMERRHAHALSGGQRQRAAFGRALVVEPALLLLDEPFSNLDPDTRTSMQDLFKQLARRRGITALLVTHDLKESMRMGDSFAMMRGGRVHAYADRKAFCADPASGVEREAAFWQAFTSGDAQVSGCDARTADS